MFDGKAFGEDLVAIVKSYVATQTAPLIARIAELEAASRALPVPPPVFDEGRVIEIVKRELASLPSPPPPVEAETLRLLIVESVQRIANSMPPGPAGKDGRDGIDGKDGEPGKDGRDGVDGKDGLDGHNGTDGLAGKDGADGKDGARGLDGAPGVNGHDGVDGKDGSPGLNGKDGADGRDGRDGVGLAGALIDREGQLVITLTDGKTVSLGLVIGRDGAPGLDGKNGADGRDGLGFEDLEFDGERTFTFRRGDLAKSFEVPSMIYRDVFKPDAIYARGDTVTWAGSLWHCNSATTGGLAPDAGDPRDWTLCAKRGREGRPGAPGKDFVPPAKTVKLKE